MLLYIILNIIIAIITILLLHHIWNYLKENYSTKKTKDLAEFQAQKYKDMFLTMSSPPQLDSVSEIDISRDTYSAANQPKLTVEWLTPNEEQWMIEELQRVL